MFDAVKRAGFPDAGGWPLDLGGARLLDFVRRRWAIGAVLALAAFLYVFRLDQNGYGNTYYAGAVKSMSLSWKAFFFGSVDTSNFITVDKPPVALQVQALSVRLFGFSSWSLLLPEALAAVGACAVLYASLRRAWGETAGVVAALALALTPMTAAVARVNLPDSLLVLLMVLSGWAAMRAVESGRLRWAVAAAVLVGVAFNVKMLQAFVVVPSLALVFLLAAPLSLKKRLLQLAIATAALLLVSGSWMAIVDSLPREAKPYIGGSTDGTVWDLAFGYNGFGRIDGNERPGGGPPGAPAAGAGQPPAVRDGATNGTDGPGGPFVPGGVPGAGGAGPRPLPGDPASGTPPGPDGGTRPGVVRGGPPGGSAPGFGGQPGWLRLFNDEIGTQVAWLIPLAVGGAIVALAVRGRAKRTDLKRAAVIFWTGWAVTHAVVFSNAQGIFHPYYTSALAPGIAALVGIGAAAFVEAARRWRWSALFAAATVGACVALELGLLDRAPAGWHAWLGPALIAGTAAGTALFVLAALLPRDWLAPMRPRLAQPAMLGCVGALLLAPGFWAFTVLDQSSNGTMPAANPQTTTSRTTTSRGFAFGPGGPGGPGGQRLPTLDAGLVSYLEANRGAANWMVAVNGSQAAAPIVIQTAQPVMAMGGFSGSDPAPTLDELKQMIARGDIRFFLLGGGGFPGPRGGAQSPSAYVTSSCRAVDPSVYGATSAAGGPGRAGGPRGAGFAGGERLYDCAAAGAGP